MPRQRRGCGAPARATHADPLRWGTDRGTGHQRGAGERCRPGATRSERSPTDRPPPPDRPPCPHRGGACLTWPDERAGNSALHPLRIPGPSPAQCGERLPHASAAGAVGRPLVTRTRSGQVMGRCCAGPAPAAAAPAGAAHCVRRRVRAGHVYAAGLYCPARAARVVARKPPASRRPFRGVGPARATVPWSPPGECTAPQARRARPRVSPGARPSSLRRSAAAHRGSSGGCP